MQDDPYHYHVIARAIDYIEKTRLDQPNLSKIAAHVGLSCAHFQRIFTQWVGVSPKKYQQYLTMNFSKNLLRDRFTLLDTTYSAGLSSTSRLHDLFITWEAMTPKEFANQGARLTISYGWHNSPFGKMLIMTTPIGICGLAFSDEAGDYATFEDMKTRWPAADYIQNQAQTEVYAQALLSKTGTTKLHMIGTSFHIKVWEALLCIPSGQVTTYSDIAYSIGHSKAMRAVGSAVGKNPVSWLIPCHRALRKSGGLGGYHWGLPVKRALLLHEACLREADDSK